MSDSLVTYLNFNQDASCVALGLKTGYKIVNIQQKFGRCCCYKDDSINIIEMLYTTSLIVMTPLGNEIGSSPRELKIKNTKSNSTICSLFFPTTILNVKLTKEHLIVVLENQIYIYEIKSMKLLQTIKTNSNPLGLCAVSYDSNSNLLAYPSPPKTKDALASINAKSSQTSNTESLNNNSNRISNKGDIILFNLNKFLPIMAISAHKNDVAAMSFSADGSLICTASHKGTIVRVFDTNTGIKLFQFRRGSYPTKIYHLQFSSDNKYVLATSSSLTVHIFRLGEEEALENKHKKKIKTIEEEPEREENNDGDGDRDGDGDGDDDDSDDMEEDLDGGNGGNNGNSRSNGSNGSRDEDEDEVPTKQRKLSQGSSNSFTSINSEDITAPIIDQNRLSVARMIRRSSQTLGRKAAQKMGDYLPSRFSSILEPTRHFASIKIDAKNKDIKSIAMINNSNQDIITASYDSRDNMDTNFLHVNVVTSEGMLYIYGLDSERGVTIRNAGKVYELTIGPQDNGFTLKQKVHEATKIPPERQKILVKGGKLDDDTLLSTLDFSKPVMVLGTPDKLEKPIEKPKFIEDLGDATKVDNSPLGIPNYGNTCYLNSSLQALFQIEDLREKLNKFNGRENLTLALRNLFQQMERKQGTVNVGMFLTIFRSLYPQFAEQKNGVFSQQDAEEAFSQILTTLKRNLEIDDLFRIGLKTRVKNLTTGSDDDIKYDVEESFKLNCHIDIKTNFLRDGIISGLTENIVKHNSSTGGDNEYEVSKTITRLPKFLVVHFIRFFWRRDINKKSKILRRVQFPFELDLSDVLDESIKETKNKNRDLIRKVEKDNLDLKRELKKAKRESDEDEEMKIASIKSRFYDDLKSNIPGIDFETTTENPSSVYELNAIITHMGASADGGHYKAYVKDANDLSGESWWLFNDDKVSSVAREKIETLAGGGESDSALLLIYKGLGL
ncbi:UBP6 [Candida oxycetoniae]|uniref:Ubiquitin carboxyl-terminal hydrolase n=1 Tax=Candida oxycetoniae TaxID=497107 RepID=A0AAI9SZ68_9ASCO|nr:UBP6 [Candida oxycetoniae]KAI3405384.2 UBP6 [Candida oxycetoniae]